MCTKMNYGLRIFLFVKELWHSISLSSAGFVGDLAFEIAVVLGLREYGMWQIRGALWSQLHSFSVLRFYFSPSVCCCEVIHMSRAHGESY